MKERMPEVGENTDTWTVFLNESAGSGAGKKTRKLITRMSGDRDSWESTDELFRACARQRAQ